MVINAVSSCFFQVESVDNQGIFCLTFSLTSTSIIKTSYLSDTEEITYYFLLDQMTNIDAGQIFKAKLQYLNLQNYANIQAWEVVHQILIAWNLW